MIQLNLLPDVKLEYIKAERSRRLVFSVSVIVTIVAVALLVLLVSIGLVQKKHLSDLTKDITSESSQLQQKPQINKILTVQNQLESLTALHASKPAASRLFSYLNELTPSDVSISTLNIDFTQSSATLSGSATALSSINKYIDTLKFTTYKTDKNPTATKPFSNIVLSSFGLSAGSKDPSQAASYSITLAFDKTIFDISQKVDLSVPSLVTTRAQIDQPTDLFKASTTSTTGGAH